MIKAVMFDLDNTIIDFISLKRHTYKEAAKAMVRAGYNKPLEEITNALFDNYLYNGIDSSKVFSSIIDTGLDDATRDRIIACATNAYMKAKIAHMHPYPNAVFVLTELKKMGLKLAIITDSERLKAYRRLDALGIMDFFDVIVTLTDTGQRKPHALPFNRALEILQMKPHEVVHVGDWPERDIHGAQALGIKTIWAKYGLQDTSASDRWRGDLDPGADYTAESFSDILNIVKEFQTAETFK